MKKAIAAAGLLLVSTAFSSAHAANLTISIQALEGDAILTVKQNGTPVKNAIVIAEGQRAKTSANGRASILLTSPTRPHSVKFVITAPDGSSKTVTRFVSKEQRG
ncbi:hypothetical protein NF212_04635 [Parasalinivibrio latis]|uniref:hypothetical protein n=1 Tax=Parasalinivibrio latis TaxID=2952610 RepID=UPI0030E02251